MDQPELLLGEWKKKVKLYGSEETIHGLVVGGGGHYERMGERNSKMEAGHLSAREAAGT